MWTKDEIRRLVNEFRYPKPRQVCICGKFEIVDRDKEYEFYRCKCGGWKSRMELIDNYHEVSV